AAADPTPRGRLGAVRGVTDHSSAGMLRDDGNHLIVKEMHSISAWETGSTTTGGSFVPPPLVAPPSGSPCVSTGADLDRCSEAVPRAGLAGACQNGISTLREAPKSRECSEK